MEPASTMPALETIRGKPLLAVGGAMGARLERSIEHWLLTAPAANPAMVAMFRDRDRTPPRDLLPWSGEFAGKYLTSAVQTLRAFSSSRLENRLRAFVRELIATQREDGYLGPFPAAERMMGNGRWDLWGQYHVMLGLLLWSQLAADIAALKAAVRCADLLCETFLDTGCRVLHAGSEEMNQSCAHALALLHRHTGDPRYLQLVREIERDWQTPPSGDYVRQALAGVPFWRMPKPRWEGLHAVQTIAELHWITGDPDYRSAFERIWWSIVEGDRHNTGGFSSGEQATGNPYDPAAIETCCTIAWMAISVDMLRLTGDSRVADELELSTFNAVMGAQHPSGRWFTYNTPMDGDRKASAHEIVFQARPGSPELNCCSVNGPRGLGMLSDWAAMTAADGIAINWLGPMEAQALLPDGLPVRVRVEGHYPLTGQARVAVELESPRRFTLRIRIPGWSERTTARVCGETVSAAPGAYLHIDREWQSGDACELGLDMRPWYWGGERECDGKASAYLGPILLAYDPRFDRCAPSDVPAIEPVCDPRVDPGDVDGDAPLLLARFPGPHGGEVTLCDFASAGSDGTAYRSWLPFTGIAPAVFSRANPLRVVRP